MNDQEVKEYDRQDQENKDKRYNLAKNISMPGIQYLISLIERKVEAESKGYDEVNNLHELGRLQGGVKFGKELLTSIKLIVEEFAEEK